MENKRDLVHRLLTNPTFAVGLLRKSLNAQMITSAAVAVLAVHAIWTEVRPDPARYFASDGIGEPVPMRPLSEPLVSEPALLDWTARAILRAYSINYVTFMETSQEARRAFLKDAWDTWAASFIGTGNLRKIREGKMTTRVALLRAPVVKEEGYLNGRAAWVIQFPMVLTYENVNGEVSERLMMEVTVVRTDDPRYPRGIAISQVVPTIHNGN